ncbi:hypothetical protein ALI22I_20285 [Saccharothrix sp. ALI-22-I]|nr:hypothetical protein ALI22I_20285 [Saccharothrix sp. ALI-22-I]
MLHAGVDAGVILRTGTPAAGATDALHRLANEGHRLHPITDHAALGTFGVTEATPRAWLTDHAIPYTTLTLTADKTSAWTDVMVEDRPDSCAALEAAGTVDYLLHTGWNRESYRPRLVRDMAEFAHAVRVHAADPAFDSRPIARRRPRSPTATLSAGTGKTIKLILSGAGSDAPAPDKNPTADHRSSTHRRSHP